jgi:hypothetical protein
VARDQIVLVVRMVGREMAGLVIAPVLQLRRLIDRINLVGLEILGLEIVLVIQSRQPTDQINHFGQGIVPVIQSRQLTDPATPVDLGMDEPEMEDRELAQVGKMDALETIPVILLR